jgi:hypothetical protein
MSAFTDAVVVKCLAEWEVFKRGKAREWWDPQFKDVGRYWAKLGEVRDGRQGVVFEKKADGSLQLDPVNKQPIPKTNENTPWSAAFISFIAREAGAGAKFKFSSYHSIYIMEALRAAAGPGSSAPWVGRRRESHTPKVGDLIACGRERAKTATFDTAASFISTAPGAAPDHFPSHTDFVVEVMGDKVVTIGGNVSNSVSRKNWPLNASGRIGTHDPHSSTASVICIMECRF